MAASTCERPLPIPLRPDREASMRSLARACLEVCRAAGCQLGNSSGSRDDRTVPLLTRAAQVRA